MITTSILNLLYQAIYLLLYPIRILPIATLPEGITSAISTASAYMALFYSILPVVCIALLSCLGVVVAIEVAILGYKVIMWVIRKIPFIN